MCWTARWTRTTNRCVITLAGEPEAVGEAAILGTGKAMELIDMNEHKGAHPRVGATDVVPFIPVEGVALEDCVALAKRVGQEIWKRYRIPIFFYEAAATRPDRVNLENVRRGQYEGLREELKKNHDRQPDIGEPKLHPTAGVTVVGARKFLVAYNVNLNTSDIGIANKIARGDSVFEWRVPVCEIDGRGTEGAEPGTGVDQFDGLRADADASGVCGGEARGGAIWRDAGRQRDCGARAKEGD